MKNYIYLYSSKQTTPPSSEAMNAWGEWMESLSSHLVDGGNPITNTKAILKEGQVLPNQQDTIIGYSIIKAESLDVAIELAKASPLAHVSGGEIRIYETGEM